MAFFYTPQKVSHFIVAEKKKKKNESDIFLILFPPPGWNPVWLASRFALLPAIIFAHAFLIVACDESEWVPLPGLGLAEKTVSRLLIVTNISSSGC